jgi:beta-lactam-binding protein with PASTA domain
MRLPLRDLFTDAPPPSAAGEKAPPAAVPYLIGLNEQEAERSLRQAGLTLGQVTRRSDDRAAPGAVLVQSPADGALVARSSKVDVTVSTGSAAAAPGGDPAPAADIAS